MDENVEFADMDPVAIYRWMCREAVNLPDDVVEAMRNTCAQRIEETEQLRIRLNAMQSALLQIQLERETA